MSSSLSPNCRVSRSLTWRLRASTSVGGALARSSAASASSRITAASAVAPTVLNSAALSSALSARLDASCIARTESAAEISASRKQSSSARCAALSFVSRDSRSVFTLRNAASTSPRDATAAAPASASPAEMASWASSSSTRRSDAAVALATVSSHACFKDRRSVSHCCAASRSASVPIDLLSSASNFSRATNALPPSSSISEEPADESPISASLAKRTSACDSALLFTSIRCRSEEIPAIPSSWQRRSTGPGSRRLSSRRERYNTRK
mmetsp:Transcript_67180/g.135386  ORF Transcript_67180/g.135386 Transcript_67180/m.135386 type:complete len:268 (-) Transcript_67180:374-1177(-)